jgi:hypothetical protein
MLFRRIALRREQCVVYDPLLSLEANKQTKTVAMQRRSKQVSKATDLLL